MEAKKDEWTAIQLDIARRAIFHDNELSFAVLEVGCRADEVVVSTEPPPVYAVRGRIAGLRTVAGMDISFFKDIEDQAIATLTVLSFPDMVLLHSVSRQVHLAAPYIPSFLSMREAHHFVDLIQDLRNDRPADVPFPQVFLIDGNGRLHERQAGLATVVGVLAGVPTIGCAKDYHPVLNNKESFPEWRKSQKGFKAACKTMLHSRGDWLGVFDGEANVYLGAALLNSPNPKASVPIFVSPGHKISLETATAVVLACSTVGRVPCPTRTADAISRVRAEHAAKNVEQVA